MEFEAQIGPIAGSHADQFKGGAILSLLNASKNQRLRSLQLQKAAVSRDHFALFLKAREASYCLVVLDRVPLTASAPTFQQVVSFVRSLQEGKITSLKHILVAHFAAPLVELQLVQKPSFSVQDTPQHTVPHMPSGPESRSEQQARDVPKLLQKQGAALVAVTITGRFTLWKYVDSDYCWQLAAAVELCPPTAMVTDVAFDSSTGLLYWNERHVNATGRQQLQDRIRGSQLYINSSTQRLHACPPTTVLSSPCDSIYAVRGGCWFVRDSTVVFYRRETKRLTSLTLENPSFDTVLACLHEHTSSAHGADSPQLAVTIGTNVYVIQATGNSLAVAWQEHVPQQILNQHVADVRALDGQLLILTTTGMALLNLIDGALLAEERFPESLTKTTEDRKFHLWVVPDKEYAADAEVAQHSGQWRGFVSQSSVLSFLQGGPICGLWGETCLHAISIAPQNNYSHYHLADSVAAIRAREAHQQLKKEALALLQERIDRTTTEPPLSRRRSSNTGADLSPRVDSVAESTTRVPAGVVPPLSSTSTTGDEKTLLIPSSEQGLSTTSALDLLIASCTRHNLVQSTQAGVINGTESDGGSAWLAALDTTMLPPRNTNFDLHTSFDPFQLLAVMNSLNSASDQYYEGVCRFLLVRNPDVLYDVVLAFCDLTRRTSASSSASDLSTMNVSIQLPGIDTCDSLADAGPLRRALQVLHVDESRGSLTTQQQDALLKLLLAARRFGRAATALVAWHRMDDVATLCARLTTAADLVQAPEQETFHRLSPKARWRRSSPPAPVPAATSPFPNLQVIPQMQLTEAAECMDVFRTALLGCLFADRCDLLPQVFGGLPWFVSFKDIALLLQEANATTTTTTSNSSYTDLARTVASLMPSEWDRLTGCKLQPRHLKACLQAFRGQEAKRGATA